MVQRLELLPYGDKWEKMIGEREAKGRKNTFVFSI